MDYSQMDCLFVAVLSHGDENHLFQMDCLFVAVLSHGDENHLFAVDRAISYEMLTNPLKSDRAASLIGKPKLFLFQVSVHSTS